MVEKRHESDKHVAYQIWSGFKMPNFENEWHIKPYNEFDCINRNISTMVAEQDEWTVLVKLLFEC
jgi:hypothetical protein